MCMKYQVQTKQNNSIQTLRKEFVHYNVMCFTETDDHYVLLLQNSSKLQYSKLWYTVNATD